MAEITTTLRDKPRGAKLAICEFGMLVNIAATGDYLRHDLVYTLIDHSEEFGRH